MMKQVFLGLGANLGNREKSFLQVFEAIQNQPHFFSLQVSSVYETKPVGGEGPDYLNAVVGFETSQSAIAIYQWMRELEKKAGRVRRGVNAPRTLDIDLLFYGHEILETPELIVPHPRLHARAFVLVPLCEIAPRWKHPRLGVEVRELLEKISKHDKNNVTQKFFHENILDEIMLPFGKAIDLI